ncbi:MAG: hypothetical protein FWH54_02950 [Methanobrevibacter sp.]|nr:hypothetical protein [Methanobrevibacter sp.]
MYKRTYIKNIIFLIFLLATVLTIVSVSYGALFEPEKKIDSGKKIIVLNKEKYKINWETDKVIDGDKKSVSIKYKSMKNKTNRGNLYITLYKNGKNKINFIKHSSSMIFSDSKIIKTKISSDKYYWSKLRPKITQLTKNIILNKKTLKYNGNRYFYKTLTDPINNETVIHKYKMNCKVYFYNKTSSIEILKKYTCLDNNEKKYIHFHSQDIRIEKYKGKLRIIIYSYDHIPYDCGPGPQPSYKYVKTNFSPKQYYLHVYKKKLETEKLAEDITYINASYYLK